MKKLAWLVVCSVWLAGCSAAGESASPVTVTAVGPTVTVTATATATVTTSAKPVATSGTLKLGITAELGMVDLTVFGSRRIERQEGVGWAVDVKACSKGSAEEPISLSWAPWTLVDDNSGTYESAHTTYSDDPIPAYPNDQSKVVPRGQCARGWIVFEVNSNTKAVELRYANSNGENVAWKLA